MTFDMLVLMGLFFGLLVLGAPVAFAIGISGFSFFIVSDVIPASIGVQQVASASQSFPLLAVPFFVLAGHMMNKTGITVRLIQIGRASCRERVS
jgi:TRAP-type mannitol/chloroaromatic compound transport system permease large subunit